MPGSPGFGASAKLADYYVEFSARGLEDFNKGLDGIKAGLDGVEKYARKAAEDVKALTRVAQVGFGLAAGALGLWVRQGIAASAYGDILSYQFEELSRQIASLFVPQIRAVVGWLQDTVTWFRSLSGAQQESLRHWLLTGVAILGIAATLPKIIAGFQGLMAAVRGLGLVFQAAFAANPLGLLLTVIAAVVLALADWKTVLADLGATINDIGASFKSVFGDLLDDVKALREAVAGLIHDLKEAAGIKSQPGEGDSWWKLIRNNLSPFHATEDLLDKAGLSTGRGYLDKPITLAATPFLGIPAQIGKWFGLIEDNSAHDVSKNGSQRDELVGKFGGFESVEESYRRISRASVKAGFGGRSTGQQTVDELTRANTTLDGIRFGINGIRPAVV